MTDETKTGVPPPATGWDGVERRKPQSAEESLAETFITNDDPETMIGGAPTSK